jgi:hypothetical protein
MAHLWLQDASARWAVLPLEADAYAVVEGPAHTLRARPAAGESEARALLLRAAAGEPAPSAGEPPHAWFALAVPGRGVSCNGLPLVLGLHALSDRDELRVAGAGSLFFSSETLARPAPFPGSPHPVSCPRCLQEIGAGTPAVRCPQCGVWHHQSPELPCWTYARTCQLCSQPSDLEAGYRWSPEAP